MTFIKKLKPGFLTSTHAILILFLVLYWPSSQASQTKEQRIELPLLASLGGVLSPGLQIKLGTDTLPLLISDDFKDGRAAAWKPNDPGHWQVAQEEGSLVYQLTAPGVRGPVRAPTSWSLLKDFDVSSFVFTGRLKCKADPAVSQRDICVFFHFQDPTHFYYVHFSASSDENHNVISIVDGKDRQKINREPPGTSVFRLTDLKFHEFKVTFDAATGEIKAYLDDMTSPILTAADRTLDHGLVGVGSFDDTGSFDAIKLCGKTVRK